MTIDGHEVVVGASIGIAIGDGTQDAEALLRDADIAMYRAKQTGKSRCELFDAALGAQVLERVGLEFGAAPRAGARPAGDALPADRRARR